MRVPRVIRMSRTDEKPAMMTPESPKKLPNKAENGRAAMPNGPARERPKLDKKTLFRLLSYVGISYRLQFFFVLLFILLSVLTGVLSSMFLRVLIDDYITPLVQADNPDFSGLFQMMAQMAGIYVVGILASYFYNRMMTVIAQGILKKIRDGMFWKMQDFPVRYFDTHTFGDTMSHFTNDSDTLRQMFAQSIPQMFASAITIVTVFAAMLITSIPLTLVVFGFIGIIYLFISKTGAKSSVYFMKQQQALGNVNGYVEEMISGQKVVKVFCHEEEAVRIFDEKVEDLCEQATRANILANIIPPTMGNLGHLQYVVLAIAGGAMAISGVDGLTLGAIVSFLQLSRSFVQPISMISQQVNMVIMALAGAKRIFRLMDEEPEEDDGCVTLINVTEENEELRETDRRTGIWAWKYPHSDGTLTYTRLSGDVRFVDVDFGYDETNPVLHNISMYAEPGEKVAFVGATGAGKTTIANLINQFYRIDSGEILYDGIDIKKIKKKDLRRSLGVVLQDTNLFTGTVMENIRYGKLDATDEEVYAASRIAGSDDFIQRLPQQYETVISGNGESLSQGQRQLLSIARAAVADPPVMILDEATSSIDTRTEAIVQKGMDSLMQGRTVFVIAHRLSTVRNADVIMVLDAGKIIERGTHEQLVGERGRYYQLYTGAYELE